MRVHRHDNLSVCVHGQWVRVMKALLVVGMDSLLTQH